MKNVCFTGHRKINITENLINKLEKNLCFLIESNNAENFYSGGAIGWDTLCSQIIIKLRNEYPNIQLHLILPCCEAEQTRFWSESQKTAYRTILAAANTVEYLSQHYYNGCMKKRNNRLVELADCCLCYYNHNNIGSGTGQTVRIAEAKNIPIINFFV